MKEILLNVYNPSLANFQYKSKLIFPQISNESFKLSSKLYPPDTAAEKRKKGHQGIKI
jgi:hypothetical protein